MFVYQLSISILILGTKYGPALKVDGLMALAPATGGPGLRLIQQPRGVANVDRLAEVHTLLVWRDGGWLAADLEVRPPGQ